MNKCRTQEFLCSTHHCTDGKQSPERESDLPEAFQPYHSWGRPGSMAPAPPPPAQSSGHHTHTNACTGLTGALGLDLMLQTQSTLPSEAWGDDVNPTKCPSAFFHFAGETGLQPPYSTWQTLLVRESWFSLRRLCVW